MKSNDLQMNVKNKEGKTPLFLALPHIRIVKLLLERKDVEIQLNDAKGHSPLLLASFEGHYDTVVALVERGADVNVVNEKNYSPLIMAIGKRHFRIAKYLIEHGADVNHKDNDGTSVFHFAVYSENLDIVQLLIDKGADVKLFDPCRNCTPIQHVCIKGLHEFIAPLVKAGADVNESCEDRASEDFCSYTALLNATLEGHVNCVRELLKIEKLDKNVRIKLLQQTALHIAVDCGHFEIMKLLVDAGCKLDLRVSTN
jgi:ankyrin repeat protein